MTQQGDGWPLGLQRLNTRVGLARRVDMCGSISFSTMLTSTTTLASPTSSSSSSSFDLDTKSMELEGSYVHDIRQEGVPLGSLLGAIRGGVNSRSQQQQSSGTIKKNHAMNKPATWFHSLCLKPASNDHDHNTSTTQQLSLGYFLKEERRRAGSNAATALCLRS